VGLYTTAPITNLSDDPNPPYLDAAWLNRVDDGVDRAHADLESHIADTVDAHDATAISYAGSTNLSSTTVEAALDELDTEKLTSSDPRLTDTRTPTAGSVVNASVSAAAAIAESKLALASDAAAGTASRRTLGTSATSACAGNDARLSDTRTPAAASVTLATLATTVSAFHIGATAPATPKEGQGWYKDDTNETFVNIGTSGAPIWKQTDAPMTMQWSMPTITATGKVPFRWRVRRNITIVSYSISIDTAITSGSLVVDLDRATAAVPATMATLYSTTGNRPTITTTTAFGADAAAPPNTVDIPAGDFLQPRIATAPVGGANLSVFLEYYVRA
jgi:hypothetical protein